MQKNQCFKIIVIFFFCNISMCLCADNTKTGLENSTQGAWIKKNISTPKEKNTNQIDRSVAGFPLISNDASVIPLDFKQNQCLYPWFFWSKNGKYFYFLTQNGFLHKIEVPALIECKNLKIDGKCSFMGMSKNGILIMNSKSNTLFVIDEKTLQIANQITIKKMSVQASCPNSSFVLVYQPTWDPNDFGSYQLLDLDSKKIVSKINLTKLAKKIIKQKKNKKIFLQSIIFKYPIMTPDGQYLFFTGAGLLLKYKIQNAKLVYKETSKNIGANERIVISPDSKYLASTSGNNFAIRKPKKKLFYIFATNHLKRPAYTIPQGDVIAMTFDPNHKAVYILGEEQSFYKYSISGKKLREYPIITGDFDPFDKIFSQPQGNGLIVKNENQLYWIQFDRGMRACSMPDGSPGPGMKGFNLWKPEPQTYQMFLKNAPEPGENGVVKKMPGFPSSSVPAYGGLYLIMHFKSIGRLGIFNIAKGSFDKFIQLDDPESLYATGGDLLIIYSNKNKKFECWDLKILKKLNKEYHSFPFKILKMGMALNSSKVIFIKYIGLMFLNCDSTEEKYAYLDTSNMTPVFLHENSMPNHKIQSPTEIRINPSFSLLVTFDAFSNHLSFESGIPHGRIITYPKKNFKNPGALGVLPAVNGKLVYTVDGKILNLNKEIVHSFKGSYLYPIYGSNMILEIHNKQANIRTLKSNAYKIVSSIKLPFDLNMKSVLSKKDILPDSYCFASATLKRMVLINKKENKIYVLKLDIENSN